MPVYYCVKIKYSCPPHGTNVMITVNVSTIVTQWVQIFHCL